MALSKYKLGQLIKLSEEINENNVFGISDVRGISIKKEFIETKADMEGVSLHPYLLVKSNYFAYVTITSRNGEKISLAYNTSGDTYIVSSSYVVFYVKECELLLPEYLFIFFNRPEFDRYSRFNSWGSAREAFSWEEMCEVDIELPPIEVQQKYVDIYQGMVKNQQAYERGLEDLKLVCDGYIEDLRRKVPSESIGNYIVQSDKRNDEGYDLDALKGISINKVFIPTKADMEGVSLTNYKLVLPNYFAFVTVTSRNGEKISLAYNDSQETYIVSSSYVVFKVLSDKVYAPYLNIFLNRPEFNRYARYNSWGSAREVFSYDDMCQVKIPIPDIEVQKSIANIFKVYNTRKEINEKLKSQIKAICPILIKGSLDESRV